MSRQRRRVGCMDSPAARAAEVWNEMIWAWGTWGGVWVLWWIGGIDGIGVVFEQQTGWTLEEP